jgi:hypothetical protein
MLTPLSLSASKLTVDDLAASAYDHDSQTRVSLDPDNPLPALASDTQFDGEKS